MASILKVDTIQDQSGNNIINENADTITIGASGDVIAVPAGSAAAPVITTTGDTNTGMFFPAADTIAFTEGGTEAMRINSDGNVIIAGNIGLGGTTPTTGFISPETGYAIRLPLNGTQTFNTNSSPVIFSGSGASGDYLAGTLNFQSRGDGTGRDINFINGATPTLRMRIDSSGNVLVGNTSYNSAIKGILLSNDGTLFVTRDASTVCFINRLTNDGTLIAFEQASTLEGNISVSGATVSYNGFTGTHWSRFIDESKPDVLRGTVMESLDQMTDWYHAEFETSYTEQDSDGNDVVKTRIEKKPYALKANEQEGDVITYNWNTEKKDEEGNDIIEQVQATIVKEVDVKHVMSKISDTVEAKNVYGVFSAWDNDDLINNDFYVASVGSYVVRIKAGQVVSKGDLLQSNGDGTAKVQADDMIRASTFAKVLSNTVIETYEDGSFIVPCSLMC
jgi:hypothetical protein